MASPLTARPTDQLMRQRRIRRPVTLCVHDRTARGARPRAGTAAMSTAERRRAGRRRADLRDIGVDDGAPADLDLHRRVQHALGQQLHLRPPARAPSAHGTGRVCLKALVTSLRKRFQTSVGPSWQARSSDPSRDAIACWEDSRAVRSLPRSPPHAKQSSRLWLCWLLSTCLKSP